MKDSVVRSAEGGKGILKNTHLLSYSFTLGDEEINQAKKGYWCHGACRSKDDTSLSGAWLDPPPLWVSGAMDTRRATEGPQVWPEADLQRHTACRGNTPRTGSSHRPEGAVPEPASRGIRAGEGSAWPPLGAKTVAPLGQKHVSISIPKGHPRLWLSSYFRDHWTSKEPCQLKPDVLKVEPHLPAC